MAAGPVAACRWRPDEGQHPETAPGRSGRDARSYPDPPERAGRVGRHRRGRRDRLAGAGRTVIRPAAHGQAPAPPASIDDPAPAEEAERGVSLASIPTEATPLDALRALAAAAAVLGEPPPGPDAGNGNRLYGAYARALWDQTQLHRTRSYARALGALRDRAPRELRGLVDELDGAAVALLRDGQEFAARMGAFLVTGGSRPRPGDRQQADWLEENYASAQGLLGPDSTVRAYRRCWADFTAWCDRHELAPSADPRTVALYLTQLRWKRVSGLEIGAGHAARS